MEPNEKLDWTVLLRMLVPHFNRRRPATQGETIAWFACIAYVNSSTVRYFAQEYFSLLSGDVAFLNSFRDVLVESKEKLDRVLAIVENDIAWWGMATADPFPSI